MVKVARQYDYAGEFKVQLVLPPDVKGVERRRGDHPGRQGRGQAGRSRSPPTPPPGNRAEPDRPGDGHGQRQCADRPGNEVQRECGEVSLGRASCQPQSEAAPLRIAANLIDARFPMRSALRSPVRPRCRALVARTTPGQEGHGVQPIKVVALDRKEPVVYEKDIEPILVNKCFFCHSGNVKEGKFDMSTYESADEGRQARRADRARQVGREPAGQARRQDEQAVHAAQERGAADAGGAGPHQAVDRPGGQAADRACARSRRWSSTPPPASVHAGPGRRRQPGQVGRRRRPRQPDPRLRRRLRHATSARLVDPA